MYESGYEWVVGNDGKLRLFPRAAPGFGVRRYVPEPGLFREFAALNTTRERDGKFYNCEPCAYPECPDQGPRNPGASIGRPSPSREKLD